MTPILRGLRNCTFLGLIMLLAILISCNKSQGPDEHTFRNQASGCGNFFVYTEGTSNATITISGIEKRWG